MTPEGEKPHGDGDSLSGVDLWVKLGDDPIEKTLGKLLVFVRQLASTEICEDVGPDAERNRKCYLDSGPYCGQHGMEQYVVKDARELLKELGL